MVVLAKVPVWMSVEEFLNWDSHDALKYELVDGEPHAMAPANRTHGMSSGPVGHADQQPSGSRRARLQLGCRTRVVPRLLPDHNVRVPDLAVTCAPYQTEEAVLTDPVLLIEILSPSNQAKTWTNVWAYTSIPSVREILILRADRIAAELLRRSPQGEWPERPVASTEGEVVLESIAFGSV
jgi:Uma2 family endonuclease